MGARNGVEVVARLGVFEGGCEELGLRLLLCWVLRRGGWGVGEVDG